jgi:hypothetical protein
MSLHFVSIAVNDQNALNVSGSWKGALSGRNESISDDPLLESLPQANAPAHAKAAKISAEPFGVDLRPIGSHIETAQYVLGHSPDWLLGEVLH